MEEVWHVNKIYISDMCKNEITIDKTLYEIAAFSYSTPKANDDLFNFKYITGFFSIFL